jgi:lipopolysaccharide transport system permease protein
MENKSPWTEIIKPKRHLLDINLSELWRYRDLIVLFVKRDFVSIYKQTVLGPIWLFIQPLFTSLIFYFIFHLKLSIFYSHTGFKPLE